MKLTFNKVIINSARCNTWTGVILLCVDTQCRSRCAYCWFQFMGQYVTLRPWMKDKDHGGLDYAELALSSFETTSINKTLNLWLALSPWCLTFQKSKLNLKSNTKGEFVALFVIDAKQKKRFF